MKKGRGYLTVLAMVSVIIILWFLLPGTSWLKKAVTWQRLANPGALSAAHASLENNCGACHTPVAGADDVSCIVCHANNESLLRRQPTSFHAGIGACRECHREHQGRNGRMTDMDHRALSRIGLRILKDAGAADSETNLIYRQLNFWVDAYIKTVLPSFLPRELSPREAILKCITCHDNEDKHFGLFGKECAECHQTQKWTLPEFIHPSPRSTDCAHCHQAPPSHYMGHFNMISKKVAGKPHAKVNQCYLCHETTSWIDIPELGVYKHH